MSEPVVYVVHCIDTEGPLHEPLEATFARVEEIFGLKLLPSRETLRQLQNRELDLGGKEADAALALAPHLLAYNDTWDKVDAMLRVAVSDDFRGRFQDSFGNPWRYNWFFLDHVGYDYNPRRRDMGYHNIFDHYAELFRDLGNRRDRFYFHHHAMPFNRHAHYCASNFLTFDPVIVKVLARRILDRGHFPACYRPGCQTVRPDLHWFLDQHIPFDYSSLAYAESGDSTQIDCLDGRWEDWRRTKVSWVPYHPHHDDYQQEGSCRRWIARCLNIRNRLMSVDGAELDRAFAEAAAGAPVVVAFSDHDFRDILPDVEEFHGLARAAMARHPGVKVRYCDAAEALRLALGLAAQPPVRFATAFCDYGKDGTRLTVRANRPIFGPQPFFCFRTHSGEVFHDNLDFEEPFREWSYVFDPMTLPLRGVQRIGLAANDAAGVTTVLRLDPETGAAEETFLNTGEDAA